MSIELSGIEGPCPCCGGSLRAPSLPAAVAAMAPPQPPQQQWFNNPRAIALNGLAGMAPPLAPPAGRGYAELAGGGRDMTVPGYGEVRDLAGAPPLTTPDHEEAKTPEVRPRGMEWRAPANFSAKLAIPGSDEPGEAGEDEASRRRERARSKRRRIRKLDKAANVMLESRLFRIGRIVVLLILGGSAGGLYLYLKKNDWQLRPLKANNEVIAPAVPRFPVSAPASGPAVSDHPAGAK